MPIRSGSSLVTKRYQGTTPVQKVYRGSTLVADFSGAFVPGVTEPFYTIASDYSGARNVGTKAGVALTTYTGTITDGVAQLTDGAVYENILFPCVLDIRSAVTLRNCRIVVPKTYVAADSIKAVVRCLNGAATDNVVFENVEIHNRAQRPFNGISGRNLTLRRCVITGCIDPLSESAGGSAPLTSGKSFTVEDCWLGAAAWWYSSTINSDIHGSDTHSHSDITQKSSSTLAATYTNTVLGAYADPLIGTGTPGSGSDAGNTYVPPSGFNFIAAQSQMEAWRATHLAYRTTPAQSMYGVAHELPTAGEGSFAAVMMNADNALFTRCIFGGGVVTVNASDTSLGTTMLGGFVDCTFFNDMVNGPGSRSTDPAVKGYAILGRTGKDFASFSGNEWFDGTAVAITRL